MNFKTKFFKTVFSTFLLANFLSISLPAFSQTAPQRMLTSPSTQNGAIIALPNYPHTGVTVVGAKTVIPQPTIQDSARVDCLIMNTGATNTMYVDFGAIATAASLPLPPGKVLRCSDNMITNNDFISIYDATAGDPYYVLVTIFKQN